MISKEVICLSQMTAKKGMRDHLLAALQKLTLLTRAEKGCLDYQIWQERENENAFVVYERFTNQEAMDTHVSSEYIQAFMVKEYAEYVDSHWDLDLITR